MSKIGATVTKQKSSPQSWDDDDDLLLIKLKEVDHLGWKQIAKYFDNRTSNACQFRWRRLKSGQLRKVTKSRKLSDTWQKDEKIHEQQVTSRRILSSDITYHSSIPSSDYSPWTSKEDGIVCTSAVNGFSTKEPSILLPTKTTLDMEKKIRLFGSEEVSGSSSLAAGVASTSTYLNIQPGDSFPVPRASHTSTMPSFNNRLPIPVTQIPTHPMQSFQLPNLTPLNYQGCISQQYHVPNRIVLPPIKTLLDHTNTQGATTHYMPPQQASVMLPSLSQIYPMVGQ